MSSYENAPATKLLATHCVCCGRALVDAQSVERGVGPDCAEKYGFLVEIDPAAREQANALVYEIAANPAAPTVPASIETIRGLGLAVLADKLTERLVPEPEITITVDGDDLVVKTPYNATFVETLKARVEWKFRAWDRAAKAWRVAAGCKVGLFDALRVAFTGERALGPKGVFVIGAEAAQSASTIPAPAPSALAQACRDLGDRMRVAGLDPAKLATDDAAVEERATATAIAVLNRDASVRAIVGAIGEFEKVATAPEFAAALNLLRAARERLTVADDAQPIGPVGPVACTKCGAVTFPDCTCPPADVVAEDGTVDCERWGEEIRAAQAPALSPASQPTNPQRADGALFLSVLTAGEGSYTRDRSFRRRSRR